MLWWQKIWCGRWDSNPQHSGFKADAYTDSTTPAETLVRLTGLEPVRTRRGILSPLRLPITPQSLIQITMIYKLIISKLSSDVVDLHHSGDIRTSQHLQDRVNSTVFSKDVEQCTKSAEVTYSGTEFVRKGYLVNSEFHRIVLFLFLFGAAGQTRTDTSFDTSF
jgi:hypothetical protein